MARMKFLCDAERCIECNACVTACKNEHEVPWGVNRRRVVTINDGKPGERSISVACMHCSDAPCMAVCPVDCFYQTDDGVVLHGGFFLGPQSFYQALRDMPDSERRLFAMTSVGFINRLYGDQRLKTAQRQHARFINSAMMVNVGARRSARIA